MICIRPNTGNHYWYSSPSYIWDVHYMPHSHCSPRLPLSLTSTCFVVDTCAERTEQWWYTACHERTRALSDEPKHRDGSSDHRMGRTPPDTACCWGWLESTTIERQIHINGTLMLWPSSVFNTKFTGLGLVSCFEPSLAMTGSWVILTRSTLNNRVSLKQ